MHLQPKLVWRNHCTASELENRPPSRAIIVQPPFACVKLIFIGHRAPAVSSAIADYVTSDSIAICARLHRPRSLSHEKFRFCIRPTSLFRFESDGVSKSSIDWIAQVHAVQNSSRL